MARRFAPGRLGFGGVSGFSSSKSGKSIDRSLPTLHSSMLILLIASGVHSASGRDVESILSSGSSRDRCFSGLGVDSHAFHSQKCK
jgi:hypothetical protein